MQIRLIRRERIVSSFIKNKHFAMFILKKDCVTVSHDEPECVTVSHDEPECG